MLTAKYYAEKSYNPKTNLVVSDMPINGAVDSTKRNPFYVSSPVVHIGAAVKGLLDEFNYFYEATRHHKYWEQTKAASSGQWKGDC